MIFRLTFYLSLLLFVNCSGQTTTSADTKFTFWTSSLISDTTNEVITYYVTPDSIIVKQGAGWDLKEKEKISYSSKFTPQDKVDIRNLAAALNKKSFKSSTITLAFLMGGQMNFHLNGKI